MLWQGDKIPELPVTILPPSGWQNHTRIQNFVAELQKILPQKNYDRVVGFNKIPGLDIYYAADPCLQSKLKDKNTAWIKMLPRYRVLLANEYAVFAPEQKTKILLIAEKQKTEFVKYYKTPTTRFYLLPPGINQDFIAPNNSAQIREQLRKKHQLTEDNFLLLFVGSGFKTKGLDRVLIGLAKLPSSIKQQVKLFIIGQDHEKDFFRQAKTLNIADKIQFLGGRSDVRDFMLAADLLVHPARSENTGTVLLEALASGLPVLTTDVCGYAHYIATANCGIVLPSPFEQNIFNQKIAEMLISQDKITWKNNGISFAKNNDLYHLPERAAALIELD